LDCFFAKTDAPFVGFDVCPFTTLTDNSKPTGALERGRMDRDGKSEAGAGLQRRRDGVIFLGPINPQGRSEKS